MSANRIADAITALQIIGVTDDRILTALVDLKPEATAESWQAGDVVRNADDPEDERAWLRGIAEDGGEVWIGPDVNGFMAWLVRDSIPTNLTRIVREGRVVLPAISDDDARAIASAAGLGTASWPAVKSAVDDADERRGVRRP